MRSGYYFLIKGNRDFFSVFDEDLLEVTECAVLVSEDGIIGVVRAEVFDDRGGFILPIFADVGIG